MSNITYGVSKEIYSYKGAIREAYGLVAYDNAEYDGTLTIVAAANDLSCDETKLQELANKCNEGNLSLVHFNDIVNDFLVGEVDKTNLNN